MRALSLAEAEPRALPYLVIASVPNLYIYIYIERERMSDGA